MKILLDTAELDEIQVAARWIHHPLMDAGILQFRKDWDAVRSAGHHRTSTKVTRPERLTAKADHPPIAAGSGSVRRRGTHVAP